MDNLKKIKSGFNNRKIRNLLYKVTMQIIGFASILVVTYGVNNSTDLLEFGQRLINDWSYGLTFLIGVIGYFTGSNIGTDIQTMTTEFKSCDKCINNQNTDNKKE